MDKKQLQDWLNRTMSDYNALVRAMDNAKLGEYDMMRNCAKNIKDNLDELVKQLTAPEIGEEN